MLLRRGETQCQKRRGTLKKPKVKRCQIFVFQETVIVCESPPIADSGFPQNLAFFASFKVKILTQRRFGSIVTFRIFR